MLYNIIVAPIEYIVGWIFMFIINKLPSLGVIGAICGVSVAINILALPLYNIAESIQENERQINKKLEYRVKRIKKGFKGDEQFMMLSEYYRQNGYHPIYALRGSLSILIEIPFFIAAYNYLSSSEVLKESSFWIFSNLGEADNMFSVTLGSLVIPINILPIIMTTINFVSGYIYTKDATTRDKIQIYVLGIVFLVLLYNSPSGLVIYWILNNVFSLMKNVVRKTKYPGRFLYAFIGIILVALTYRFRNTSVRSRFYFIFAFTLAFILFPFFISYFKKNFSHTLKTTRKKETKRCLSVTLISGLALAALCGFLLPSSTIASSPEEFSYLGSVSNPSSYVWSSLWFFVGLFVFWPLCIYKMFGEEVRFLESAVLFAFLAIALADVFIFTGEYGTLNVLLYAESPGDLDFPTTAYKIGPVIVVVVALAFYLVMNYINKMRIVSLLCLSVMIAELWLGGAKLLSINDSFKEYAEVISKNSDVANKSGDNEKIYHLSKEGKNVVVLFLDRAFSGFFPYALEKLPELNDQLSGFVYYPNTVSFGGCTTFASPAMMGGYEYTPEKMNDRDGLLVDIHNEASLVTPTLFRDAGYTVTVTDPPFPNYSWGEDLSAFDNVDGINVETLKGKYSEKFYTELKMESNAGEDASLSTKEGVVNFSVLQILPPLFRYTFETSCRNISNQSYSDFVTTFSCLYYLPEITDFSETSNTYIFIENESTHEPIKLEKDLLHKASEDDYFESNYPYSSESTYKHYSVFVAAMKQVGKWLDYLKTNGVYDNTRIIIVADHARSLESDIVDDSRTSFLPLLLVKDFNSRGEIKTDYTFMTNADTILLATECLEEVSDVNPYTGNKLKSEKDEGINAYLMVNDDDWNAPVIIKNDSFTLDKNEGWHISENIFDESCWVHISEWEEERK